jgi:hypothetical protein
MIRALSAWRRRHEEDGSALILALVIVTAVGILMATALSFAGTTLGNTPALRNVRNQSYYAQGAVDGAINSIRGSSVAGSTVNGAPCPTYTPPVLAAGQDSGADGSTQFQVTCQGLASGSEPGAHAPVFAIETLSSADDSLNQSGNKTVIVDGGVYSAGGISTGSMMVNGSVYAVKSCSGVTTSDPLGLHCNQVPAVGGDPHYAPAIASASALASFITTVGADPAVTCDNSHVAKFSPGYYSEQPLTLLADSTDPDCAGQSAWWFQPGFYYFDFTNAAANSTWNVGADIVGGTPKSGTTWTSDGVVPWGSACDSSLNADSTPVSPGVQFIFGGTSSMSFGNNDQMELCGPSQSQNPGSPQSIALYGLGGDDPADAGVQGTSTPVAVPTPPNAAPTFAAKVDPTSATSPAFSPTSGATTIGDSSTATATLNNNNTASLDYSAFKIPAGAHVNSLTFHVARTFTGVLSSEKLKATWPNGKTWTSANLPSSCNPCDVSVAIPSGTAEGWRVALDYSATAGSGGATVTMDGIAATVSYIPPTLETLSPNHLKLIDAGPTGSPHVTLQLHGTVYAPSGGLGAFAQNSADLIFSRGVILWNLDVKSNPSFTQTAAPFQTPGETTSRLVQFIGQVSHDSGSTWTSLVQACVAYNDNNSGGSPGAALPGYTLNVKNWTILRSSSTQAPTCS